MWLQLVHLEATIFNAELFGIICRDQESYFLKLFVL